MAAEGGCDDAMRRLVCVLCNTRVDSRRKKDEKQKKANLSGTERNCTPAIQNRRINNEKCARHGRGGAAAVEEEKDETATGGKRNLMSDGTVETLPRV